MEQAILDGLIRVLREYDGLQTAVTSFATLKDRCPTPCLVSITGSFTACRLMRLSGGISRLECRGSVPIGKRTSDNGGHVCRNRFPTCAVASLYAAGSYMVLSNCGEPSWCSSGRCQLDEAATGCLTIEAYDQLFEEFMYVNDPRDTSRLSRFYIGGLCKRFPEGTVVYVMENRGLFAVKVRYTDSPGEPDRWMSAEALR